MGDVLNLQLTLMTKYVPTLRVFSKQTIKERYTSVKAWQLPKQESALAPEYVWTNKDMDPVGKEDQTWTLWTWVAYWATDTINLGTWETASSSSPLDSLGAVQFPLWSSVHSASLSPCDILIEWNKTGHGGRAAAFFAALSWYIAQVGTNVTANSISAADDLTVPVLCKGWPNKEAEIRYTCRWS